MNLQVQQNMNDQTTFNKNRVKKSPMASSGSQGAVAQLDDIGWGMFGNILKDACGKTTTIFYVWFKFLWNRRYCSGQFWSNQAIVRRRCDERLGHVGESSLFRPIAWAAVHCGTGSGYSLLLLRCVCRRCTMVQIFKLTFRPVSKYW